MLNKLAFATRMVLGIFYLLSGLNWFFGFIPILPYVGMPADMHIKHAVVVEMINTGWMFQSAKIMELLFGISLLTNRYLPLMLAAALPVAFITFMLDALILDDIWRWMNGAESGALMWAAFEDMVVGGLCVLLPHLWLMWGYMDYYCPAGAAKATIRAPGDPAMVIAPAATSASEKKPAMRALFFALGLVAFALQAFNLYLFASMIRLH